MKLTAHRIILFVANPRKVADFYVEKLGLKELDATDDDTWIDLDAGTVRIALHYGVGDGKGDTGVKLAFFAKDVAKARTKLLAKGVKLGKLHEFGDQAMCDGKDPAGHRFQISNRA